MRGRTILLAAGLGLLAAAARGDTDPAPMEGSWFTGSPDGGGPQHLLLSLQGEAARWLYKAMTAKAEPDECFGGTTKLAPTGLQCTKYDDGTYECFLAVDPATGQLAPGADC